MGGPRQWLCRQRDRTGQDRPRPRQGGTSTRRCTRRRPTSLSSPSATSAPTSWDRTPYRSIASPFTATGYAAEGALVPPFEDLALALTEADAVAPPFNVDIDLDAFFASAIDEHAPVVLERAPEMQRVGPDILSPPLDAK